MKKTPYEQAGMVDPMLTNAQGMPVDPMQSIDPMQPIDPMQSINVGMPGSTPIPARVAQNMTGPLRVGGKVLSPVNMNPGFEALPEDVQNKILKK